MERYVGLAVHAATCTLAGLLSAALSGNAFPARSIARRRILLASPSGSRS